MTIPRVPSWIYKRDGRLVAFEADEICRSLFAAGERLGRPDAFTARELTDGVLHFLAVELDGATPTTAQVAELVEKIVRELGHPQLAAAFAHERAEPAQAPPSRQPSLSDLVSPGRSSVDRAWQVSSGWLRERALREVYGPEVAAAHSEGLLTLTGLEAPFELAACVLGPFSCKGLAEAIIDARDVAGGFLVVDAPEFALAELTQVADFTSQLGLGLRATGLRAVVNLHCRRPPAWAEQATAGPLFGEAATAAVDVDRDDFAGELAARLLECEHRDRFRIDWHLTGEDLRSSKQSGLLHLARQAVDGAPLAFVFDRPKGPVSLAEGLKRGYAGVLAAVGLSLPALCRQMGSDKEVSWFLPKLKSLVRLGLSAGRQKRQFLRQHSRPWPGFLLDRARLVVTPVGLDQAVRHLTGQGLASHEPARQVAERIVGRIRDVLDEESRPFAAAVDSWPDLPKEGLDATPREQLKAAGQMETAEIVLPARERLTPEEVIGLLRHAWEKTEIVRLRLSRTAAVDVPTQVLWDQAGAQ